MNATEQPHPAPNESGMPPVVNHAESSPYENWLQLQYSDGRFGSSSRSIEQDVHQAPAENLSRSGSNRSRTHSSLYSFRTSLSDQTVNPESDQLKSLAKELRRISLEVHYWKRLVEEEGLEEANSAHSVSPQPPQHETEFRSSGLTSFFNLYQNSLQRSLGRRGSKISYSLMTDDSSSIASQGSSRDNFSLLYSLQRSARATVARFERRKEAPYSAWSEPDNDTIPRHIRERELSIELRRPSSSSAPEPFYTTGMAQSDLNDGLRIIDRYNKFVARLDADRYQLALTQRAAQSSPPSASMPVLLPHADLLETPLEIQRELVIFGLTPLTGRNVDGRHVSSYSMDTITSSEFDPNNPNDIRFTRPSNEPGWNDVNIADDESHFSGHFERQLVILQDEIHVRMDNFGVIRPSASLRSNTEDDDSISISVNESENTYNFGSESNRFRIDDRNYNHQRAVMPSAGWEQARQRDMFDELEALLDRMPSSRMNDQRCELKIKKREAKRDDKSDTSRERTPTPTSDKDAESVPGNRTFESQIGFIRILQRTVTLTFARRM
ncbi:hypothetical protein HDU76_010023 [Blyttiomyces sp. JEL0837]|nr:hypothetical protein HDU76_010023 [Blyttiomyces sp. JEL0837]